MKSGNLNFLEPSGSPQACNGSDLPLPFAIQYNTIHDTHFDNGMPFAWSMRIQIEFCVLFILIVMFMHSYCYVCSVLGILFHCVVLCIVFV